MKTTTIYRTGQIYTQKTTGHKHTSSQSNLAKSQKPQSAYKSNKIISLSQLLDNGATEGRSPRTTPSNAQQLLKNSTNTLTSFKKIKVDNIDMKGSPNKSVNQLLKEQLTPQSHKFIVYSPQMNKQQRTEQAIRNLNFKLSVKNTLIDKIQKSVNLFKGKIQAKTVKTNSQCTAWVNQLSCLINTHETIYPEKNSISKTQDQNRNVLAESNQRTWKQQKSIDGIQIRILTQRVKQLENDKLKDKQELQKYKQKIENLEQKMRENGFQLAKLDMIKQKWMQAEEKIIKLKNQGQNPEKNLTELSKNSNSSDNNLTLPKLSRENELFIVRQHPIINNRRQQYTSRSETINQFSSEKNNIIQTLTKERNDFYKKLIETLEQVEILKLKCNMLTKNPQKTMKSHEMEQFIKLQEIINKLKQKNRDYELTIDQLQQNIEIMKLKEPSCTSEAQASKQIKQITHKCKQLQIERDLLLDMVKGNELTKQRNSILQQIKTSKQTKKNTSRFEQMLNSKQRASVRSFSEHKSNENEFYRYKVDERYLQLKRKIHQIHQTYANAPSTSSFFQKYSQKQEVPQKKAMLLQMIRDALAILNTFQQTIIIQKSQLKKFNKNKLRSLGKRIKKTKQQNNVLRNKIQQQLHQFKQEINMNIEKING